MQFSGNRRKKPIGSSLNDLYDHCLQFYGQPPLENISLTEFETFAVERLKCKLLKNIKCSPEHIWLFYIQKVYIYTQHIHLCVHKTHRHTDFHLFMSTFHIGVMISILYKNCISPKPNPYGNSVILDFHKTSF